jgi:hypothetical protein
MYNKETTPCLRLSVRAFTLLRHTVLRLGDREAMLVLPLCCLTLGKAEHLRNDANRFASP